MLSWIHYLNAVEIFSFGLFRGLIVKRKCCIVIVKPFKNILGESHMKVINDFLSCEESSKCAFTVYACFAKALHNGIEKP